jgi:hypothetical protein
MIVLSFMLTINILPLLCFEVWQERILCRAYGPKLGIRTQFNINLPDNLELRVHEQTLNCLSRW